MLHCQFGRLNGEQLLCQLLLFKVHIRLVYFLLYNIHIIIYSNHLYSNTFCVILQMCQCVHMTINPENTIMTTNILAVMMLHLCRGYVTILFRLKQGVQVLYSGKQNPCFSYIRNKYLKFQKLFGVKWIFLDDFRTGSWLNKWQKPTKMWRNVIWVCGWLFAACM